MKLKIIRPNTVIHCKTREESECLLNELHKSGIKWSGGESLKEYRFDADYPLGTGYWLSKDMVLEWAEISYFTNRTAEYGEIIPFSSLVIEEKTYDDGLNEAWDFIRKIYDLKCDDIEEIFNTNGGVYGVISSTIPIKDMIAKLEAYEAEKHIKVGDVVKHTDTEFVVTCIGSGYIRGIDKLGVAHCFNYPNTLVKKAGKHIDISSILAEIGKE